MEWGEIFEFRGISNLGLSKREIFRKLSENVEHRSWI